MCQKNARSPLSIVCLAVCVSILAVNMGLVCCSILRSTVVKVARS